MKPLKSSLIALAVAVCLAPAAVLAEKGGKHGKEKGPNDKDKGRPEYVEPRPESRPHGAAPDDRMRVEFRFGDQDRYAVRDYYGAQAKGGKCPPGLAKKGNGCMPPGQAKKWAMGRPLPRDVVYHDLPYDLMVRLPAPPAGHRYVQVAGDVLLIAVGTSMVVDAIQDILR